MSTHNHNMGRADAKEEAADARMHALLRDAGPLLEIPADPTADDTARWTGETAARLHERADRAVPARRPFFTQRITRAVSGVAALFLIAMGLYIGLGRTSSAQASTILKALRGSTFSGLHVTFKGLRVNGFEASGEGHVRFGGERSARDLFDPSGGNGAPVLDVKSLALSAHLTGDEGSEMPGLIGDVSIGMSPDESWAYFKSPTPNVVAKRLGPVSESIAAALPGGVLVQFGGTSAGAAMPSGSDPLHGIDISKLKPGMNVQVRDASQLPAMPIGEGGSSTQVMVMSAGSPGAKNGGESDPVGQILPLLRGQAGVVQLQELARSLNDGAARDADVAPQPDGSYLLTIHGRTESTRGTTARIAYREKVGVEWIELLGIGDTPDSFVRIECLDGEIPTNLLDASRLPAPALRLDARGK